MRLAEPVGEHAVLGNPVQHAVRSDDGGVHRAGKNQRADHDDEHVKDQSRDERAGEAHGQSADQVFEELRPGLVRNDHHREERNQRREHHAVNKDYERRFFQVQQLGVLDFAIYLCERFLAAHGQHGMAQPHENSDQREALQDVAVGEPAECVVAHHDIARCGRRRQVAAADQQRVSAPGDQRDHHHRGELHDPQRFFTRFGNSLDVLPPEIQRGRHGEHFGGRVGREREVNMAVRQQLVQQSRQVLAGGNAADGAGEDVVEHQRRNRKFRQRPAHRFLHHAIHAAAHEHAATFDVKLRNRVRQQHRCENEPGRGFSDELFGLASGVIRGRRQVV